MEKHIKDFENYTINTKGEVYNTLKGKVKKPQRFKSGYLFVSLFQDGRNKMFLIHRLVAEAFIPNPQNKPQVGHWDCDRTNNNVENLYWCTAKENMDNPITRQNISESRKGMEFSEEHKKHLSDRAKTKIGKLNNFYGKKHSEETKQKMSESHKKKRTIT